MARVLVPFQSLRGHGFNSRNAYDDPPFLIQNLSFPSGETKKKIETAGVEIADSK